MLDHPCVKLPISVGRASEQKSKGCGFKSHVKLTLYLESSKSERNIEYHMYHLIPYHILINLKENGK